MKVKEAKDTLREEIKERYVTILNFCKKKKLPYDSFRIWLHNNNRTKDIRKINAIREFGNDMVDMLKNQNLKKEL